jgi:hypothetical protein
MNQPAPPKKPQSATDLLNLVSESSMALIAMDAERLQEFAHQCGNLGVNPVVDETWPRVPYSPRKTLDS